MVITSKHYGYIKWTIHISALALSWRMVFDTMTKMSTAPFWQAFFGFGAVFVELFAQFDWGLALTCAKTGLSWKAFWLKAIYLIYIVVFAFLSAVGTFSGQVNKSEQIYSQADFDKSNLQDKIKRDETQIQNKSDEQKIEFADHGRGRKYNQLQAEIDNLKAEQAGFEAELKKASMITINSEKSVFDSMHDMIPKIPANGFKMAFFAALMLMIYTALILTPWKVDPKILSGDETTSNDKNNVTPPVTPEPSQTASKHRKFKPVTALHETVVTDETVTYDHELCICGCGEPRRSGSKYHGNACKTRMSRDKKKHKQLTGIMNEGVRVF